MDVGGCGDENLEIELLQRLIQPGTEQEAADGRGAAAAFGSMRLALDPSEQCRAGAINLVDQLCSSVEQGI